MQSDTEKKPLLIYSASAGSGKTYNLVKTYLELILKGNVHPTNFAKIIAMTFTNKAALEMKTRIVDALADLSYPQRHDTEKEREKAYKYRVDIAKDFEMKEMDIEKKAQLALTHILHQYEDFYVMTIDKFNLRLIRSFAMDLNLETNFKVVIDESEIQQRVVDDFLNEVDNKVSSLLSKIFLQMADDRMDDGQGWNFERELMEYLKILEKEESLELLKATEISDLEAFVQQEKIQREHYYGKINELIQQVSAQFSGVIENTDGIKAGQVNVLKKIVEKAVQNSNDIATLLKTSLFTPTALRYVANEEIPEPALSFLRNFIQDYSFYSGEIEKNQKIRKSSNYIQLLKRVNDRLKEYRESEQIIRISEFNQMISDLLQSENTDFIYEKLGTRYNHFLLDEFQDTSRLQWHNIVPLVHESLSNYHKNLIVGDPKQSIYRFRGGVAEQFIQLPRIYNPKGDKNIAFISERFYELGRNAELADNYRSSKEVVKFNNTFFKKLVAYMNDEKAIDFNDYYKDIVQNVKSTKKGYVELVSLHSKTKKSESDEEEEAENEIIAYLLNSVNKCLEDGYEKGDICILGDTSFLCNQYALALSKEGHKVVSSDSLAVDSENTVNLCIAFLKWRSQVSNELLAKQFIEKYLYLKFPTDAVRRFMQYNEEITHPSNPERTLTIFNYRRFVNEHFGSWDEFHTPFENLYALLEKFYEIAGLNELNNPYLHHLSDLAFNYDLNNGPDLASFIDYYENSGFKSSIQTPENKDAIKIMTCHKSKGLEFKVVIMPQVDSNFLKARANYLVELDHQLAYTTLSENSTNKELLEKYKEEYKAALLDKLNLVYVAFTRAVDRLYVQNFYKRGSKTGFGPSFLHPFLQTAQLDDFQMEQNDFEDGSQEIRITVGQAEKVEIATSTAETANFTPVSVTDKLWFPSISLKKNILDTDEGLEEHLRYGRQLHFLLSEIETEAEIAVGLQNFLFKGKIEKGFIDRLQADLHRILSNATYQSLLQGRTQTLQEQAIIISEQEIRRPDKVILKPDETIVIDFKTGLKQAKYQKQVQMYCKILREMGYPNVKGCLLYTEEMEFVEVE